MASRGDVVLLPFPYTDLSASKVRPAVVVSSAAYQAARNELLIAYVTSQLATADPTLDYVLQDGSAPGLLKPSVVKPRLAAIDPSLVQLHVGTLSARDLAEVSQRLRLALDL